MLSKIHSRIVNVEATILCMQIVVFRWNIAFNSLRPLMRTDADNINIMRTNSSCECYGTAEMNIVVAVMFWDCIEGGGEYRGPTKCYFISVFTIISLFGWKIQTCIYDTLIGVLPKCTWEIQIDLKTHVDCLGPFSTLISKLNVLRVL